MPLSVSFYVRVFLDRKKFKKFLSRTCIYALHLFLNMCKDIFEPV